MSSPSSSPRLWSLSLLALLALGCEPEAGSQDPEPRPRAAVCEGADALARAWDRDRRLELEAALESTSGEWPRQALRSLDARVAERGEGWRRSYLAACERDELARLSCLERQVAELDAALSLIVARPERAAGLWAALERSPGAAERCEGLRDEGAASSPLGPELARELVALDLLIELRELDAVAERIVALERALDSVEPGAADRVALSLAATAAVIEAAAGRTAEAEGALARASELAEPLGPRAQAFAARARARVALEAGELEAAEAALGQALDAARTADDPRLTLALLRERGRALVDHGQPTRALEPLAAAVALASRLGGPDDPITAELQTVLAEAQRARGQIEAAHDSLTQAREGFLVALGPDHPQTLATVAAVGKLFVAAGQPGDAQFAFLDLLEIYTELYGPKDWRTAKIKLELADSLMAMDQHDSARTLYTEALTPLAQALGADHRAVVRTSIHLGIAELALGELAAAEGHCTRGRDLARGLAGGDDPLVDEAERCLAELATVQKQAPNNRKRER